MAEELLAEELFVPYASTIHVVRSGPDGPRVIHTFGALGAPNMALTPDGSRLYVLSGDRRPGADEIDVASYPLSLLLLEMETGRVIEVPGVGPRHEMLETAG